MKLSSLAVAAKILMICSLLSLKGIGQTGVLDPNDPIVVYNPAAPPATPPYGTLAKWVKTNRVGFNTSSFKSYYYKGLQFRLKFPKSYQHGVNDGKKYPLFIFFHGIGERGSVYDNEYQLYHGGELHMNAVNQDQFDGFLLYPQTSSGSGFFSTGQYDVIRELVENYFVPQVKVDINRVLVDGLSGGGVSSWLFVIRFPQLTAASLPISAAISKATTDGALQTLKFTPIWQFQGGLDESPTPANTENIINAYRNAGAQINYTLYPNQGHGCWYSAWTEPDYFPYMLRAHKANPWPLGGRTEFCPGDPINVTLGVTTGFTSYEWRKNGVVIPGANSNQITVTEVGIYDCRIQRGSEWSVWSPRPVEIKIKTPTATPPVTMVSLQSRAIPALDTTTGVLLQVPAGYASYQWQKVGSGTVIGTQNTYKATTPGGYRVQVTEQFGCSSAFSDPFYIVDANGTQKPDAPGSLSVTTLSKTSLRLDWINTPAPQYNEENFEIYQASASGGPYKLIAVTGPDLQTHTVTNLNSNSTYFYKMRALNSNAASAASNMASGSTQADVVPPTAPRDLRVLGTTRNSISVKWEAATDDVGVTVYDVYVNGAKSYSTANTEITVYNLTYGQNYLIRVKARDFANNASPFSNQVTAQALMKGLNYKYYTFTGTWNNLPDFNTLTPVKTGITPNVSLAPMTQGDNFAFLWEGYIRIPVSGTYTFRTNSDDGSKLYLSTYSHSATALVNNDGLHGGQDRDGTITLTAGVYPIAVTFYEQGGGEVITVSWSTPQTGGNFVQIPDSVFNDVPLVTGTAPAKPTGLTATALSIKSIQLNWTDNSNNETGFEIYRSTSSAGPFATIGVAAPGANSYIDSTLSAATTYYYRIRAIGEFGESVFDSNGPGIGYEYYEGAYNVLPDFSTLTPVATGRTDVITIAPRLRNDNFAFKWTGTINITNPGNYTFYTASDDGSRLYIDGFDAAHMVVDNDGLHGTQWRNGTVNLSAGPHTIYVTFFELGGGEEMAAYIEGPGVSGQLIPAAMLGEPVANATTLPLPGTPAPPTNLVAGGSSFNSITVTWNDQSNDETGFEVYRAAAENGTYILLDTVPANTSSFENVDLSTNAVFYYKVRAINAGGSSVFSNTDSATTYNHAPVLTPVINQVKRYDVEMALPITATDQDGGMINISFTSLPAFASYAPGSNGTGVLTLQPVAVADMGTYNFEAIATDQFGGSDTVQFSVVINDNHTPVLAAVSPVTINEQQSTQFTVTATDADASDNLTWSFTGLPGFAGTTVNGASVTVNLTTGYADHGVYPVLVKVTDNDGAFDTATVLITVNNVDPNKKFYVNIGDATYTAPAPWNNTAKTPVINDVFANLKDATGATTPVSLTLLTAWTGVNNQGSNTGNNSGVYPDNVIRSSYYTTTVQSVRIGGLDLNYKYKLTFMASRANPTVGVVTAYGVGATSVNLNAANNINNVVSIDNLTPNASGQITFTVQKASGSTYGYLNALVIDALYDDGTAPARARDLTAGIAGNAVQLNWTDAAYNESSYEIYRATVRSGAYTLLTTGLAGMQTYQDATALGSTTYYYAVKAVNAYGFAYSDTVSISTPNISPILNAINNISMTTGQVVDVPVTATDTEGDIITLQVTGLPSYASFTDNGNGTGVIHIAPGTNTGVTTGITVIATDNHNASASRQFSITVTAAPGTPVIPANVKAFGLDKTRIRIEWTAANAQTAYEVWRSGTADGTFQKIADVAAGGNNYINTGLTTGVPYYYKVRSLVNGNFSDYSNVVAAMTVGYVININLNDGSAAGPAQPGNWNNLNALINTGFVLPNLINDQGQNTGINLGIARNFSGFNSLGASTGNNSGIYPDNVMKSFYYCNFGDTAQLLISGLNLSQKYNFAFFGSRANPSVSVVSVYKIGDQIVTLNAANNTSNTAVINNITPDANGNVLITIYAANSGGFGYLNALTISGIPYVAQPGETQGGSGARVGSIITQNSTQPNLNGATGQFDVNAYPNPFVDDVTLKFDLTRNVTKFTVLVIDISGRIVHRKEMSNVPAGSYVQKLGLRGAELNLGMYFIKVLGVPELANKTIKVLKQR
jgi:predicted esterase